jgi:hypothetical protein
LVEDWPEYLKGNDELETQETLLHGIRTGLPTEGKDFVELIENLIGRELARRKAGRPLRRAS